MQYFWADLIPGTAKIKAIGAGNFLQAQYVAVKSFGALDISDVDGDVIDSTGAISG